MDREDEQEARSVSETGGEMMAFVVSLASALNSGLPDCWCRLPLLRVLCLLLLVHDQCVPLRWGE